jgi:mRNA interferase RelE/StbE
MTSHPNKWRVVLLHEPEKVLKRLPRNVYKRIRDKIDSLTINPTPNGCKKLAGHENLYRIRIGDWRVTYAIENNRLVILIVEVAPRGGAHRDL